MSNLATITNNILADSGIDDINVVVTNGSYSNPSWITALSWTKITDRPTTLSGYGITDAYTQTQVNTLLNAKLSLSGGVMTGPINLFAGQFYESAGVFALDANNSDLIGLNGLYFDDFADSPWEGLNWYNTATTWDSLWSASGVLYYTPNRTNNTIGTSYTVYHSGNLSSPVTGTGANTRIAYWTGSGTLSGEDSFAYDSANNRVRINANAFDTIGAAAKLIVNGVLSPGSDAAAQIDGFIRIKDQLIIHNGANTTQDAYIQAVGAGVLTVGNKLLINTSSIVGAYQLDVNGTVRFYNNTTSEQGLTIENQGIGDAGINIFAGTGKRVTQRYYVGNVAKWGLFVNDSGIGTDTFGIYNYTNSTFSLSFGNTGAATFLGPTNNQARFIAISDDALVRIIANNYGTEADARLFLGENDTLGMTFEYDGQNNIGHIGMNDSVDPTGAFSKRISMPRAGTDTIFGAGNVLFSSFITAQSTGGSGLRIYGGSGTNQWDMYLNGANLRFSDNTGTGSFVVDRPATFSSSVTAGGIISTSGTGLNASVRINNTTASTGKDWHLYSLNNGNFGLYNNTDGSYAYQVTPSGNLGLGVTPSAWLSNFKVLQLGDISSFYNGFDGTYLANNTFVNTSSQSIYLKSRGSSVYLQNGGIHYWYTAPSGTAGNAISFTQAMTLFANGDLAVGATSSNNSKLRVVADWNSGFSTVGVQGLSANQAGYGLYNIAGTRVGVWAYTGSVIYFETETSGINMNFNPAGITSMTLEGNGNVSIGRLTSGVTRADIYLSPSSTNSQLYFGRLSSTNDDNTKVYFVNRIGSVAMFVDTGAQRVQIKSATTPNYTAYDLFVSRGDQYGGGIDVQNGLVRFRGDDDWLYINRAGTDVITIDGNNRVGIGTTSNNGKLQITGSHVGGYGMLNMNSVDSCIIAMDSSTSWDVRLRYKFQGVDYWFAGMVTDNTWRLTKGDNTAVLYATQGNNVYIPNGGLQIASEGGFTGSAKFLVGSFLSAGSGAIAQFNGFLRIRDQIIIHNNSNTGLETYLQCTGANALTTGGSITATSFFESSDVRLKTNIADYNPVNISDIAAKIYEKDGKLEIGYLAQDLQGVINSAVSERENGYLDLSYRQVHTAKIAALEAKIKQLESQLNNR